jgi:hypothetical protein
VSARSLALTPGTLRLKRLKDRTGKGTATHKSEKRGKSNLFCNYGEVRFKYMTATPEAMHGVKLKIEKQGMKLRSVPELSVRAQPRSPPYNDSHDAYLCFLG